MWKEKGNRIHNTHLFSYSIFPPAKVSLFQLVFSDQTFLLLLCETFDRRAMVNFVSHTQDVCECESRAQQITPCPVRRTFCFCFESSVTESGVKKSNLPSLSLLLALSICTLSVKEFVIMGCRVCISWEDVRRRKGEAVPHTTATAATCAICDVMNVENVWVDMLTKF